MKTKQAIKTEGTQAKKKVKKVTKKSTYKLGDEVVVNLKDKTKNVLSSLYKNGYTGKIAKEGKMMGVEVFVIVMSDGSPQIVRQDEMKFLFDLVK